MTGNKIKQIPYGVSDFEILKKELYYYVDKTNYIFNLEELGRYLFLIRPRRFGKSLLLSMLESYYDIAKKDQFEEIFEGTAIKDNPTKERNSYLIMKLNFSEVNPALEFVEESFEKCNCNIFNDFIVKYQKFFDQEFLERLNENKRFTDKLNALFSYAKRIGLKLYVLLDEYDNFANTILSSDGKDKYKDLTHGGGFFRYFFNVLKGGTTGSGAAISRLFITGVSPVTMDDVTSGFNIGSLISLEKEVNELLGLTEKEVKEMLRYYISHGLIKKEEELYHYEMMSKWYNNYKFASAVQLRVFNTDMVLYYVKSIIRGNIPDNLIDSNVKIDYKKLRHLMTLDKNLNGNFSNLESIIEHGEIKSKIINSFPAEGLIKKGNFISLLYYFGLLTIDTVELDASVLKIPNLSVKSLYYEYFREALEDVEMFELSAGDFSQLLRDMALKGEWEQVFDYLAKQINNQTSVRDYLSGEKVIQGFLLAYLNIVDLFIIRSEYETNKGFADLYLEPFIAKYEGINYSYLVELKYVKREDDEKVIENKVREARDQLIKYEHDYIVQKTKGKTKLKKLILVFKGWELIVRQEV